MGFYRFNEPGQPSSIAHVRLSRRGGEPAACPFPDVDNPNERCARMSEALCDGDGGKTLAGNPLTCDAPMCKHHRTSIGPDRDLCPRCVAKRAAGKLAL